jgi:hypothetical protein
MDNNNFNNTQAMGLLLLADITSSTIKVPIIKKEIDYNNTQQRQGEQENNKSKAEEMNIEPIISKGLSLQSNETLNDLLESIPSSKETTEYNVNTTNTQPTINNNNNKEEFNALVFAALAERRDNQIILPCAHSVEILPFEPIFDKEKRVICPTCRQIVSRTCNKCVLRLLQTVSWVSTKYNPKYHQNMDRSRFMKTAQQRMDQLSIKCQGFCEPDVWICRKHLLPTTRNEYGENQYKCSMSGAYLNCYFTPLANIKGPNGCFIEFSSGHPQVVKNPRKGHKSSHFPTFLNSTYHDDNTSDLILKHPQRYTKQILQRPVMMVPINNPIYTTIISDSPTKTLVLSSSNSNFLSSSSSSLQPQQEQFINNTTNSSTPNDTTNTHLNVTSSLIITPQ